MRRGTRGAGAYRRRDGAVAGEMAVLSRFWGPKRDKIVPPDTKSAVRRTFGHRSAGGRRGKRRAHEEAGPAMSATTTPIASRRCRPPGRRAAPAEAPPRRPRGSASRSRSAGTRAARGATSATTCASRSCRSSRRPPSRCSPRPACRPGSPAASARSSSSSRASSSSSSSTPTGPTTARRRRRSSTRSTSTSRTPAPTRPPRTRRPCWPSASRAASRRSTPPGPPSSSRARAPEVAMAQRIFISYRRDDSRGYAGRLQGDLSRRYSDEHVFRDVEIPPGADFGEYITAWSTSATSCSRSSAPAGSMRATARASGASTSPTTGCAWRSSARWRATASRSSPCSSTAPGSRRARSCRSRCWRCAGATPSSSPIGAGTTTSSELGKHLDVLLRGTSALHVRPAGSPRRRRRRRPPAPTPAPAPLRARAGRPHDLRRPRRGRRRAAHRLPGRPHRSQPGRPRAAGSRRACHGPRLRPREGDLLRHRRSARGPRGGLPLAPLARADRLVPARPGRGDRGRRRLRRRLRGPHLPRPRAPTRPAPPSG